MPLRPPVHQPHPSTRRQQLRALDDRRGSSTARGYGYDWQRFREHVLAEEPLCRFCAARGLVVAATDVDHILPLAERPDLRLVRSNVRSLCHPCHSARTARGNVDDAPGAWDHWLR